MLVDPFLQTRFLHLPPKFLAAGASSMFVTKGVAKAYLAVLLFNQVSFDEAAVSFGPKRRLVSDFGYL